VISIGTGEILSFIESFFFLLYSPIYPCYPNFNATLTKPLLHLGILLEFISEFGMEDFSDSSFGHEIVTLGSNQRLLSSMAASSVSQRVSLP